MSHRKAWLRNALRLGRLWQGARLLLTVVIGALLVALGYALFLVPFNIAAGGLSGVAIIVNHFSGLTVGLLFLVMNIPLIILGFFELGRWRFLTRTLIAVPVFSVTVDVLIANLPGWIEQYPVNDDLLLNALYGGIVGGIGAGILFRAGATLGGTGVIGRIIRDRTGVPMSQAHFYTDGFIILVAGVVFGWEIALYALLTLFLHGMAADFVLEGPSVVRTATIITDRPQEVRQALIEGLGRGVSQWDITGGYTGRSHTMLMCTIQRSQMAQLKEVVASADAGAFVVIGNAHQAMGEGFARLRQ